MADTFQTDEHIEKVILIGVDLNDGVDAYNSLNELSELADTAGAVTLAKVVQARQNFDPATYIGSGKIQEVKDLIRDLSATGVICDDELTPAQLRNLEDLLDTKVMDRTMVILDIFATRANTSEGKIQVEMAQLKYRMTRLSGFGVTLSRLGGGIGTRGPGEKKIETDRRIIKERITKLSRQLKQIQCHRDVTRKKRESNYMPVAAIVGYTNAGKSTLLNKLTGSDVLSEDKLFATLDPTTRMLTLARGEKVLLTDTVGFIHKLPHNLIDAFKSTLEEAKYADIIVHVVDSSNPDMDMHMKIVYETLNELGVKDKTIITLFNKSDIASGEYSPRDFKADYTAYVSAKTGEGLEEFKEILSEVITKDFVYIEKKYNYNESSKVQDIRAFGQLIKEEYQEDGIYIKAYIPKRFAD